MSMIHHLSPKSRLIKPRFRKRESVIHYKFYDVYYYYNFMQYTVFPPTDFTKSLILKTNYSLY